jgi:phospholipase C
MTANIDPASKTPLSLFLRFETNAPDELITGVGHADIDEFHITLLLTLQHDGSLVDVLSWVPEIQNMLAIPAGNGQTRFIGTFLGEPVDMTTVGTKETVFTEQVIKVHLNTTSTFDPGGHVRRGIRDRIFGLLTDKAAFTGTTGRESINRLATQWIVGDDKLDISGIGFDGGDIVVDFSGTRQDFVFPDDPSWPPAGFTPGTLANIDHIVVLTMENRSFDHLLGYLSLPAAQGGAGRTDVDGLKGGETNFLNGVPFQVHRLDDTFFSPDPPHGYEPTHRAINGGLMDGFVRSWAEQHGRRDAGKIMGYHTGDQLKAYDALARDFAVGHRWFAPHPGPTFPNRYYQLTGRPNLDADGFWEFDDTTPHPAFTRTIFDYLPDSVSWAYYEQGYNFLRLFESHTFDTDHIRPLGDFFTAAVNGTLPNVAFIDPHFVELPPDANADGAPADVIDGQNLVNRIVEFVIDSPNWDRTLMVIVYDEHGGFYDHVPPPHAPKISPDLPIDTFGVRVPAFVISPWVPAGSVFGNDNLVFDHTSLARTIARRFMPGNPPYLGARYAAANDLSAVVTNTRRSGQFRPFVARTFTYGPSGLSIGIKDGQLWQLPDADTFTFEEAGENSFYLRHRGTNLYATVSGTGIVLAPKVIPGTTPASTDFPAVELQRWTFLQTAPDTYSIHCKGVPIKVLQPASSSKASPLVLNMPTFPPSQPDTTHVWKIQRA